MLRGRAESLTERLICAEWRLEAANICKAYSLPERLHTLWVIEYFGIPRRQMSECPGVARSTVWRWLRSLRDGTGLCGRTCQAPVRHTSKQLVQLVWLLHELNPDWGRRHIAMVLGTLGIFPAASMVCHILLLTTGVRRTEAVGIALDDIDPENGQLLVRGKWSKERTVPLTEEAVEATRHYLPMSTAAGTAPDAFHVPLDEPRTM